MRADWSTRYERNVAVLLRDRASGTPLYEAHAQTDGATSGDMALLGGDVRGRIEGLPGQRRAQSALGERDAGALNLRVQAWRCLRRWRCRCRPAGADPLPSP